MNWRKEPVFLWDLVKLESNCDKGGLLNDHDFFFLKQAPAPQKSSNTSVSLLFPRVAFFRILRALSPGSGSFPLPLLRPWEGWTQTTDRSGSRERKAWCWRPEHVREANGHLSRRGGALSSMKPFNGHCYSGKVGGNGWKSWDGMVWGTKAVSLVAGYWELRTGSLMDEGLIVVFETVLDEH